MSKVKTQYLLSTDSLGMFGHPEQFIYLWKKYFDRAIFDGVEAIGFKPVSKINNLIRIFKENNIRVLSIHGKTGGENELNLRPRIIMTFLNYFILNAKTIILKFPQIDFLSHAPHFKVASVEKNILKLRPKKLWIENHLPSDQGMKDVIEQVVYYRKMGIDCTGMLDVYHFAADNQENITNDWEKLVREIKKYTSMIDENGRPLIEGIHFPIGNRVDDSLPIFNLTDSMLNMFAVEVMPNIQRIVFENQQSFPGMIFSHNKLLEKQKDRNETIVERLIKTGIIKL